MIRQFTEDPIKQHQGHKPIFEFASDSFGNLDKATVESFGEEWNKFYEFADEEIENTALEYFDILPIPSLNKKMYVLDAGCGTGRWTKYLSKYVGFVEAVDPSSAIFAADKLLCDIPNVRLVKADIENMPFVDNTFDLVISIGVLHHIPDTSRALAKCVSKVKKNGRCYVYLYYNLDNRGHFFRLIFRLSNFIRRGVSSLPTRPKLIVCDVIAALVYLPMIYIAKLTSFIGLKGLTRNIPLSSYRNKSWFVIRANALDRFGTPLEQRFSKDQVMSMMNQVGLTDVVISQNVPFYHAIGTKV